MERFIINLFSKIKSNLNLILLIFSLIILIYFCLVNNNLIHLCKTLPHLNQFWLAGGVFSLLFSWLFESKILKLLITNLTKSKLSNSFFYKLTIYSEYFSAITPMGIGSQATQILKLKEKNISATTSLIILTKKFLIYQIVIISYSVISVILYFNKIQNVCPQIMMFIITGLLYQCFLILPVIIFFINKNFAFKLTKNIIRFCSKLKIIKNPKKALDSITNKVNKFTKNNIKLDIKTNIKLYLLSFLQITFLLLIPFFVFKAFNHTKNPIFEIICTQSIANVISSFTPLPGASGTAESSFLKLFSVIFPLEEIAEAMLICRGISFYFIIIIGILFHKKFKNNKLCKKA